LPAEAVARIAEIQQNLQRIEAGSPQFAALQRSYFSTVEKYLDCSYGTCALQDERAARAMAAEFESISEWRVDVTHYSILPNHWHAMLEPHLECVRSGAVWQREWFDRWMRDDAEYERCVAYIRENPVKAGLVRKWTEHRWTK
jgi:REP element-mobilizing transposase RayT